MSTSRAARTARRQQQAPAPGGGGGSPPNSGDEGGGEDNDPQDPQNNPGDQAPQQDQGAPAPPNDVQAIGLAISNALTQGLQGIFTDFQQNQTTAIAQLGVQMVTAINAIGANQQAGGQAPPAQVAFARNPGMLNPDDLLDYAEKQKLSIYKEATKPLYASSEELFDMSVERFNTFMTRLKERCTQTSFL